MSKIVYKMDAFGCVPDLGSPFPPVPVPTMHRADVPLYLGDFISDRNSNVNVDNS